MASMKAKKGNPWEREVAYNFKLLGFKVERLDDNTKGIDLLVENMGDVPALEGKCWTYTVECKHHKGFTWNKLKKIYKTTEATTKKKLGHLVVPMVVFKGNNQPPLIMYEDEDIDSLVVIPFVEWQKPHEWKKVPKGYKVWQN